MRRISGYPLGRAFSPPKDKGETKVPPFFVPLVPFVGTTDADVDLLQDLRGALGVVVAAKPGG